MDRQADYDRDVDWRTGKQSERNADRQPDYKHRGTHRQVKDSDRQEDIQTGRLAR